MTTPVSGFRIKRIEDNGTYFSLSFAAVRNGVDAITISRDCIDIKDVALRCGRKIEMLKTQGWSDRNDDYITLYVLGENGNPVDSHQYACELEVNINSKIQALPESRQKLFFNGTESPVVRLARMFTPLHNLNAFCGKVHDFYIFLDLVYGLNAEDISILRGVNRSDVHQMIKTLAEMNDDEIISVLENEKIYNGFSVRMMVSANIRPILPLVRKSCRSLLLASQKSDPVCEISCEAYPDEIAITDSDPSP